MLKTIFAAFRLVWLLIGLGTALPAYQGLADTAPPPVPTEQAIPAETPLPKTNAEIRQWYNDQVAPITRLNETWMKEGLSAERAKRAYELRHSARIKARAMMQIEEEVTQLQRRDMEKYGNPDGPTFDYLVQKNREAGRPEMRCTKRS